eukprot:scaffold1896_cov121-Isochrysis_galbana.AAC.5
MSRRPIHFPATVAPCSTPRGEPREATRSLISATSQLKSRSYSFLVSASRALVAPSGVCGTSYMEVRPPPACTRRVVSALASLFIPSSSSAMATLVGSETAAPRSASSGSSSSNETLPRWRMPARILRRVVEALAGAGRAARCARKVVVQSRVSIQLERVNGLWLQARQHLEERAGGWGRGKGKINLVPRAKSARLGQGNAPRAW